MASWEVTARRIVGSLVAGLSFWNFAPNIQAQVQQNPQQKQKPAAPAQAPNISFAPRWSQGETRSYEQIKTQRITKKGQLPNQVSSRARIDLKVLEAGKSGYLLSWSISAGTLEGERAPEHDAHAAGVLKLLDGWTVLLDLDASGNLIGVRNWKELQPKMAALQDSVLRSPEFQKLPAEKQVQLRGRLEAERKHQTREHLEELCTREVKAFLAPIGLDFKGAQPIVYDAQFPNPKGGKPFPASARFELTRIDPASGRALVDWKQVINPNVPSQGLGESLSRLGKNMGRPPRPGEASNLKTLSISDECRYLMDSRTGWVLDMNHLRVIQNENGERSEESLRIRRYDPKAQSGIPKAQSAPTTERREPKAQRVPR